MKKLSSIFLVILMLASVFCLEYKNKATNFEQGSGYNCSSWAKAEVDEAMQLGLIPEEMKDDDLTEKITRGEFAAIAIQYLETKDYALNWHGGYLADVDDAHEYSWYIRGAYQLGITEGTGKCEDGTAYFSPNLNITREQMATMLYRTLEEDARITDNTKKWLDFRVDSDYLFRDDEFISEYAYVPVYFMSYRNLINGTGNDYFSPKETATREQAILLSLRMYKEFTKPESLLKQSVLEGMTEAEKYEINIFLSNFSEAYYDFDNSYYESDEEKKIDFAILHARINYPSYFSDLDSGVGINAGNVDKILERFFGRTASHATKSKFWSYENGNFVFPVWDGDTYSCFSIATSMFNNGDGTYTVEFNIYEDSSVEPGESISDKTVYTLSPYAATQSYAFMGYGSAVVKPKVHNGANTYELVDYRASYDWKQ